MSATYDANERVVSQDDGRSDHPLTRFAYGTDAQGNATTTVTDRTGQVTTYHFNGQLREYLRTKWRVPLERIRAA
jgi:hypothetical protein